MRTPSRLALILAAVAFFAAAATAARAGSGRLTADERSFLAAINQVRKTRSLSSVLLTPGLERAAREHSADMLTRDSFAHFGFPARLWKATSQPVVGEDLGWSVDDGSAVRRVVTMWLASTTHRRILLRPGFRYVGVGVSRGRFLARPRAVVVTADFAGH